MTDMPDLVKRNGDFAARGFRPDLTINPIGNMMVVVSPTPLQVD